MKDRKQELEHQMNTLKKARETAEMNRTEFSIYMGIPRRTLEEWESGRRKAPDYVIRLIAYKIMVEKYLKDNSIEIKEVPDE